MFVPEIDDFVYYKLKRLFDETPWGLHKMRVRNLGFFARLHYNFFIKVMSFRIHYTERRFKALKRNLEIQERAYVILSCRNLFTDKFNELLKSNFFQQSQELLESIKKELKQCQNHKKN